MSTSTQATDGEEIELKDREEERSATENETDELVDVVPSSSASRSVRRGITCGSGVVPLPMDAPKRPLPSDQTQKWSNAALQRGLSKLPVYDSIMAPTAPQGKIDGDDEGSSAERFKRRKISNTKPTSVGEDR